MKKKYPTIAACGLDCGLCPKYYTDGPSRCPGCAGPNFADKHPSCSFITCCVKKHGLEVCGQCPDFPCAKFKTGADYRQVPESSSYPPYRKVLANLHFVKEHGIGVFMKQQRRRIRLLEKMLANFNDGRSRSCYCHAAALLDPDAVETALAAAARKLKADHVDPDDLKTKATTLRTLLATLAPDAPPPTTPDK